MGELDGEPAAHVVGADRKPAGRGDVGGDGRIFGERRLRRRCRRSGRCVGRAAGMIGVGEPAGIVVGRVVHAEPVEDFSRTNRSQLWPVTSSISWPATM